MLAHGTPSERSSAAPPPEDSGGSPEGGMAVFIARWIVAVDGKKSADDVRAPDG
jgi:hypothetical protein